MRFLSVGLGKGLVLIGRRAFDPFYGGNSRPRGCADTVRCGERNVARRLRRARSSVLSSLVSCILVYTTQSGCQASASVTRQAIGESDCCIESGNLFRLGRHQLWQLCWIPSSVICFSMLEIRRVVRKGSWLGLWFTAFLAQKSEVSRFSGLSGSFLMAFLDCDEWSWLVDALRISFAPKSKCLKPSHWGSIWMWSAIAYAIF